MIRKWMEPFQDHMQHWVNFQLNNTKKKPEKTIPQETEMLRRFKQSIERRQAEVLKIKIIFQPYRIHRYGRQENISYQLQLARVLKVKNAYHIEEQVLYRMMKTHDGHLIIDKALPESPQPAHHIFQPLEQGGRSFAYDRREAVQYAETWWNDYNPQYETFTDNCTNFISQCLRAGNAPMRGQPDRSQGWWYQNQNWSYSWAVAHSFRWYLSSSTAGLTAKEVEEATDLALGDVICYDFNGDDRWQHSTIVTSFDGNGEPLVNAQTTNSRARYWTYEDSTAWTPNIRYKFFRIGHDVK
ncbi:amidase domain-containing protein [Salibacterium aidingense]|uniref:amidase domain-containing protein n=1 Tax=Salibacterium aidingense TaxID=384933 RepID=UPI003BCFF7EB